MSLLLRSCRSTIKTLVKNIPPAAAPVTWHHATKPNNNNSFFARFIQKRAGQVDDDEVDEAVRRLCPPIIPHPVVPVSWKHENLFVDPEKPDLFDCIASDWSDADQDEDYDFEDTDDD